MSRWLHREICNKRMAARRAVWNGWDWSLQDTTLAKIHGVSREYCRQLRKKLHRGKAVRFGEHTRLTKRKAIEAYCRGKEVVTVREVAAVVGCARSYAQRLLSGMPVKVVWGEYQWHLVDWTKSNRVIAAELGCTPGCVGNYRYRHGKYKPGRGR